MTREQKIEKGYRRTMRWAIDRNCLSSMNGETLHRFGYLAGYRAAKRERKIKTKENRK